MMRKDVEKHKREAREKHLDLALDTVSSREEQHKTLSEGEALVFKLQGYASKKEENETFYSAQFYSHCGGYKVCIEIHVMGNGKGYGTHLSIFIHILKGRYDSGLKWPFCGSVTHELLNQLADDCHHKRVIFHDASFPVVHDDGFGYSQFIFNSSLGLDPATNTQYLLDDTLYFRVSVKVDNHRPAALSHDPVKNTQYLMNDTVYFRVELKDFKAWLYLP